VPLPTPRRKNPIEYNQNAITYSTQDPLSTNSDKESNALESPCLQEHISFELRTFSEESNSYEYVVPAPQQSSTLKSIQGSENKAYDNV
jgi:hypothetical protein